MQTACILFLIFVGLWSFNAVDASEQVMKKFVPRVTRSELKRRSTQNTTTIGVDLIQPLTDSTAKCLTAQNENLIAIPRAFYDAKADINARTTMKVSEQNNFLRLSDGLFGSCATCSSDAYSQISGAFAYLASDSHWSGTMWVSITAADAWTNDVVKNQVRSIFNLVFC